MKERVIEPESVVALKGIKGLDAIEAGAAGAKIGANATLVALIENEALRKGYPALVQALESVGTPQIRHVATLGGNLCAKTPCAYYQHDGFACPKKGNPVACPAKEGENEHHAIFATDYPCVSVHASSAAPALMALGAKARIAGPKGAREIAVEDLFAISKEDPAKENVLAAGEIITHVMLGAPNPKSATYVVLHKASHDWPVGLASVALEMMGGTSPRVVSARICLGAVAPIPLRAKEAEAALTGERISTASAAKAADAAVARAAPLSQNAYKVKTTHTAVKRAVLLAATGQWM
jgi:xanthine dehydrogenase YagS FAD-binding subunit